MCTSLSLEQRGTYETVRSKISISSARENEADRESQIY